MSKHTPGREWTLRVDDGVRTYGLIIARGSELELEDGEVRVVEKTPLVTAARELLEACKSALDEDSGLMCSDRLRAAIAKAEGRE